jgi:hypothetical protein
VKKSAPSKVISFVSIRTLQGTCGSICSMICWLTLAGSCPEAVHAESGDCGHKLLRRTVIMPAGLSEISQALFCSGCGQSLYLLMFFYQLVCPDTIRQWYGKTQGSISDFHYRADECYRCRAERLGQTL